MALTPLPTTLVLEHHDSYTRNLLATFSQIIDSPPNGARWDPAGWKQRVVIVNVDTISWDQFVLEILPHVACVILGPGPGSPHKTSDFSWPARLIEDFGDSLPIFGLCLGHQGLATTFGASVVRAAAPRHGQITHVRHSQDRLFAGIPSPYDAVQYNSLTVDASSLPTELEAIAWATNKGKEEILGLRHRAKPLWGVQYHPESIASTYGATLLSNFLSLALSHYETSPRPLDLTLPLPSSVLSHTTSYTKQLPNPIPDVSEGASSYRWEQRSVDLGGGRGRTPREVFEGFVKGADSLGEVWLDSARPTGAAQFTHLLHPQATWTHTRPSDAIIFRSSTSSTSTRSLEAPHTFITTLATAQAALHRRTRIIDPTRPSFPVGFVGYLGYEMKEVSMPLCKSPTAAKEEERTDSEFALASLVLTYSHEEGKWVATGLIKIHGDLEDGEELLVHFGVEEEEWDAWLSKARSFLETERTTETSSTSPAGPVAITGLVPDLNREEYMAAIEHARESIIAGDAYELCTTTQFRTTIPSSLADDPYSLYLSLRAANPAPYSYYFHLPLSNLSLLSSSPERFMRIDKDRHAEMKPIKGTVRRSDDPAEDQRRKAALEADEKERAENLMIVDLSRNDLLGFCSVESVQVPRLMVVESYQTVHQLVTSVVGTLTAGVNPFEAVGRAFPPGSMTGAPKLRSLKLLEDLEGHRPRGVYSGIFGFVAVDGTTDFSVVIRTLVIKGNKLTLGAGGAITHLSDAAKEWEEVLVKTEAVLGNGKR